ncbi:phage tail protein [Kosakonia pseudosacchari]|uniref:phage tail protein n=1 Tax=Kosakonia pseudosacchari TaxID=1646340 RepID=UPI00117BB912|nr:phage tail protein [Kosakonia pseudosacchari]
MSTAILDEKNIAISEGNITVYNYKPSTGEYIGSENEYLLVGLGIPGNSTIPPPPVEEEGKAIVWNGMGLY